MKDLNIDALKLETTSEMKITDNKFYISEIFESIQGEGNFAGARSLFIRFHYCNLTCKWCDTKYTWSSKSGKFKQYTESELREIIRKSTAPNVVFTGGEPLLYRIDQIVAAGTKRYHAETNGCFNPKEALAITLHDGTKVSRDAINMNMVRNFNWVVSPKLSNSGSENDYKNLKFWTLQTSCIFKFIVNKIEDLDEVEDIAKILKISEERIYIGLEGVTPASQMQPAIVDEIIKRRFNFSPRLQVLIWGNQRGK